MKKISIVACSLLAGLFTLQSCDDVDDQVVPVNDFIWKGLNQFYLWQEDVPNLSDSKFANQGELNAFLGTYSSPTTLFEDLLYRRDAQNNAADRFSVMTSDYRTLENLLVGVAVSNGMEFGLVPRGSSGTYYGYVRYVLPDTDAADKGLLRGDLFYAVNGTEITAENYYQLLYTQTTYTLNMADYNGGNITPNGRTVSLTKSQYAENPIYLANTYTTGSHKIGYLMYNGFYNPYDNQLNNVFGQFASDGVTDLVLDLRYNGGGSVNTATRLGSMITGQFNGQLFAKEQWNSKMEAYYKDKNPGSLVINFPESLGSGVAINSLHLNKVYVLVTGATASASELVINSLKPYIDVTVIGSRTVGKNMASVTLYDSFDFSSKGKNNAHRYAMQPLVLKTVNKDGLSDYTNGMIPDDIYPENYGNLGVLGDPSERLYQEAIRLITQTGRRADSGDTDAVEIFKDSKSMRPFGNDMYIENLPQL
nr:S41 family peptidase [uncultured Flavobacterium sp.]